MNAHFHQITSEIPELFERLIRSDPFLEKGISAQKAKAGIYIFYDGDTPVYVGRTRNLQRRLSGHISTSHESASFAFRLTRITQNKFTTYKSANSRPVLFADPEF
jgi:hypothetical protein